jgi:hypothetical protein
MSTLKTNNVQVGQSVTATNNFTIYQPSSPDGTVRIGVGNSGATTGDAVTINSTGIVKGAIVSGTAVASTSGTSVDFTGIPSTAKRITVMLNGVSANGTSPMQVQVGSGSFTTSGYFVNVVGINSGTGQVNATTGFYVNAGTTAASVTTGQLTLSLLSSNTWVGTGLFLYTNNAGAMTMMSGNISLSGTLDRVRITTVNGTDTFDAGTINIMWEG